MSPQADAIVSAAMALPLEERAAVAEQLLASLGPEQAEIDRAWKMEIEKRIRDKEQGTAELISGEEFLRSLRTRQSS